MTSTQQPVLLTYHENGIIAELRLNRPERLNAMSLELVDELHNKLDELMWNTTCRVVLLIGNGKGFCAGADLRANALGEGGRTWESKHILNQERFSSLVSKMRAIPQPIIALVHGPAAGGGMALALACDVRVVSESAKLIPSFLSIGLSGTELATSYFLPKLVGLSNASYFLMTAEKITATKCMEMGLATKCVRDDNDLLPAGLTIAKLMCNNSSRLGLVLTKRQLSAATDGMSLAGVLASENNTQLYALHDDEARAFSLARSEKFITPKL